MHALHFAQVPMKTVIADFSTFEIIKMQGATEERAPMKAGPFGKIVADFPDGPETIDYANLLLEPKPVEKKKSMKKKKAMKKMKKKPAVCKKPAAAVAASSTEDEDEDEEEEEGEEEEMVEDEEEEVEAAEGFEAPAALALPAAVPALPLPAAPEDCCMQCN
jgi:hypothetical protein